MNQSIPLTSKNNEYEQMDSSDTNDIIWESEFEEPSQEAQFYDQPNVDPRVTLAE